MVLAIPNLLLLSIILTIFTADSYANDRLKRYKNLYGYEDFNTTVLENIVGITNGIAEFLRENEIFLKQAPDDVTPKKDSRYDFIVVGAGTAGATVAARLSEINDIKVLLIEAGNDETLFMDFPITAPLLQVINNINWAYETEPSDKYCLGMKNHKCKWPRGRVMGGSSVLNYMIATRGSPDDYDHWAGLGNDGWAYKDVLKYFKKLESMQIDKLKADKEYHNTGGPVPISYPPFHSPVAKGILQAGIELGYPLVDYNGKNMTGYSYIQSTTLDGLRVSSNKAYLNGKTRKNLHVTKNSMVNKILIDLNSKQAIGVQFVKNNELISVYAKKEVILCAGTIGSAQLLMVSGIGPADHLKEFGINVVKDAPVGDNLMDHIAYGGLTFLVNQPAAPVSTDFFNIFAPYLRDFWVERKGPATILGGCETIAFIDVDDPKNRDNSPNVELLFLGFSIYSNPVMPINFGFSKKIRAAFSDLENVRAWGVFPIILRPKSRGKIRLKSKDVNVKPAIIANYLDDPEDIRILIQGIRAAIKVSKTKAMKRFGSKLDERPVPGCEGYKFDSDDYWLCHLRTETINIYHYSGTCKMGPVHDKTAVVDPRLKVIGIKGLRVADASIMPRIVSGHTNIPTYMIAEKLADMVKEDWSYPTD